MYKNVGFQNSLSKLAQVRRRAAHPRRAGRGLALCGPAIEAYLCRATLNHNEKIYITSMVIVK